MGPTQVDWLSGGLMAHEALCPYKQAGAHWEKRLCWDQAESRGPRWSHTLKGSH